MGDTMSKAEFGTTDKLASGRWRARYRDEDGRQVSTGTTYASEKEARKALNTIQIDLERGQFFDERKGNILFKDHAADVAAMRTDLSPGTIRNNASLLNKQLLPYFGSKRLRDITIRQVDQWWATVPTGAVNRRNGYFLLSNLMKRAVRYGYIQASPCQVEDAGKDVAERRPTFSEADFRAVVDRLPQDLHVVAWVLYGAHLRIGEVCGLNYSDYKDGTLTVVRQYSDAGKRMIRKTKTQNHKTVALPPTARAALDAYVKEHPALPLTPLFPGPRSDRMNAAWLRGQWNKAREAVGLPEFHPHDVRHVGLTRVAQNGGSTREVMARGGHASVTAAMRYQHASQERDQALAAALG